MSHENVEVVRRGFEAWEADDFGGLLALMDDDLVTRRLAPMPDPGVWHGPEGLIEVAAEWMETFDEFTMKAEEYIDAGDHVVVRVAQEGRGEGSGAPVTGTFWFVYGVRNGKAVTLDMYATRQQALEAAGVSQENVEIVESFYRAWARDEFPGPIELMDREIEYVNPAGAVEPGTRRGLAAFSSAVEKVFEGWETWQMEPEQFRAAGDQVAVVVRYRARGRGSGVEVEGRESALWTLHDGKVARYAWFHEPGDALEAAGLGK